ncbi:MAG: hypothetical protein E6H94_10730 [Chloroflexi bacterium]|nr:MAG: hypothetical protein E6H94_10730 [Chloroflexota bacterium]
MIADLAALYERRQLLGDFAWRELRARYKGSALGFAWNFFIPLLQLVVFTILFGVLLRTPSRTATGDQPYAIFLFAGLVPWTFFASSLQGGAASVVANGAIVKRVRMPVQLLPAASVLSALVNLVASTAVLLAVPAVFGPRHPEGLLWLPLLVAVQWFFVTPVLFPVSILADRPRELALLHLNPMTAIVVGWQRALLDGAPPEWDALAYAAAFGIVLFVAGFAYFRRAKDGFEAAL